MRFDGLRFYATCLSFVSDPNFDLSFLVLCDYKYLLYACLCQVCRDHRLYMRLNLDWES